MGRNTETRYREAVHNAANNLHCQAKGGRWNGQDVGEGLVLIASALSVYDPKRDTDTVMLDIVNDLLAFPPTAATDWAIRVAIETINNCEVVDDISDGAFVQWLREGASGSSDR